LARSNGFPATKAADQIATQAWLGQVEERVGQPTQEEEKKAERSRNSFQKYHDGLQLMGMMREMDNPSSKEADHGE
jgi:hypothetical protein